MRAVPSHGTFPMRFPWESHSRGQACQTDMEKLLIFLAVFRQALKAIS